MGREGHLKRSGEIWLTGVHFATCESETWLRGNEFGGSLGCSATGREPGCEALAGRRGLKVKDGGWSQRV